MYVGECELALIHIILQNVVCLIEKADIMDRNAPRDMELSYVKDNVLVVAVGHRSSDAIRRHRLF